MSKEIGEIFSTEEGSYRWAISLLDNAPLGEKLCSPSFTFSGAKFRIYLKERVASTGINVTLCNQNDSPPEVTYVKIGMCITKDGRKLDGRLVRTNLMYQKSIDIMFYPSDLNILLGKCQLPLYGTLTIFCEMRRLSEEGKSVELKEKLPTPSKEVGEVNEDCNTYLVEEQMVSQCKTLKKLQKDLNDLFLSGEDCDCTLKVQTKEFSAHKNILRARSPVFKSMFSHDMKEKRSGVVAIDDCDPKTFPDFLKYLYSGSTEHIDEKNVCHLYTASDKYQVEELKQECAEFMKSHLSVETFCDFFALGLKHSVKYLIDSATKFFCGNVVNIAETPKWQIFLQENSTVGNELFLKVLSRGRMT